MKNEDDLKKMKGTSRQGRNLIFGMQPYFDPIRRNMKKKLK